MLSRHFSSIVESLVGSGDSYAELSVERIITAGGISRSTFYSYFDDKGDLLVAMAQDVIGDLVGVGHAWWDLSPDATKADLREALRVPIDTYRAHRTIFGAVVETAAYDARVRDQQRSLIDQVVAALAHHIAAAQKAGTADATIDPERSAQWTVWMLEHGLYQLISSADENEVEQLLGAVTDMIWRIFYAGCRPEVGSPTVS
jgi:TetR/AcrR family transcriptional regulator, ethionamide resistance regulator